MSSERQTFVAALARGSGRAMTLLKSAADPATLHEELVYACVCNLTYDQQCEDPRGPYLARLVTATGQRDSFWAALTSNLLDPPARDRSDVPQLFDVLTRLAIGSDEADTVLLRSAFASLKGDDRLDCQEAFVRLDGLPALIICAEQPGFDFEEEPWRARGLLEQLRERDGPEVEERLALARATHAPLARLLEHVEAERDNSLSRVDAPPAFADARAALLDGRRPSGVWFTHLSNDQQRLLADDLDAQTVETRALNYLILFARRPFPGRPETLLRWTDSETPQVARSALNALQNVQSPLVRSMAIEKLRSGDPKGVRLLLSNFEPGDLTAVRRLFRDAIDDGQLHELALSGLALVERHTIEDEERIAFLLDVYERNPCSYCRRTAVELLEAGNGVPRWLAEECLFDADQDTARLFASEISMRTPR